MRRLVDIELIVTEALRDADIANGRVYTAVPRDPVFPLVVVRRLGGTPVIEQYLDVGRIQVDAWAEKLTGEPGSGFSLLGGGKAEAHDLALDAQLACHGMRLSVFDGAVVTAVEDELGLSWIPDPKTERPRYSFTVAVFVHPAPSGS